MPTYTVTIEGEGVRKTVEVNTDGMSATVVEPPTPFNPASQQSQTSQQTSQGGKRSSSSFRLKKRRITRKLKKTR